MKFLLKGILTGGVFVLIYWLGTLESVESVFRSTGAAYHLVKAGVMFTVGYWLKAATSAFDKR